MGLTTQRPYIRDRIVNEQKLIGVVDGGPASDPWGDADFTTPTDLIIASNGDEQIILAQRGGSWVDFELSEAGNFWDHFPTQTFTESGLYVVLGFIMRHWTSYEGEIEADPIYKVRKASVADLESFNLV